MGWRGLIPYAVAFVAAIIFVLLLGNAIAYEGTHTTVIP